MAMAMAQERFTLQCDLCKGQHDIKWKCLDCNEWLCFNCKTAHNNSKASKDHQVVSLTDADAAEQQHIKSKLCIFHTTEPVCMYCKDCKCLLCLRCITGDHKSHDFENLSDIVNRQVTDLTKYLDGIRANELAGLQKTVKRVHDDQQHYNQQIESCINNMRKQGRQLKEAVDKIVDTSITKLERRARDDQKFMKKMETEYVNQLSGLEEKIVKGEKEIKSSNFEIINMAADIKNDIKIYTEAIKQPITVYAPTFTNNPLDESAQMLKQQFGYLDFEMEDERGSECVTLGEATTSDKQTKKRSISKFFSGNGANKISCCNQYEGWIADGYSLTKIRKDGNIIKSIKSKSPCFAVTKLNTGQLLISTNMNRIDTLNFSETATIPFCNTNSSLRGGICVALDSDIFQCQQSRIVKMSPNGKEKQIIDFSDGKYAGVTNILYLTQNVNGDLWVTDGGNKCVVLNRDGKFKFNYNGLKEIKTDNTSEFYDLAHNKKGEIFICDYAFNTVHMVDSDGKFLQFVLTEDHGIQSPHFISHDGNRGLWVGCDGGFIVIAEY